MKAILNNEVVFLNALPDDTNIDPTQITEHNEIKYFNPSGAVIVPDVADKPSSYHKWSGSAWIPDTNKKQELITVLEKQIDAETDATILTGFVYDNNAYYLSLENQMNFKGQNDIRENLTYPVKIKHQKGYAYITDAAEYHIFFLAGLGFKQTTIEAGWNQKDALQDKTTAELIELLNTKNLNLNPNTGGVL